MSIIAVANQKGGVGKTSISVNLAGTLAQFGKKVLLVDMDPQGNSTSTFFANIDSITPTVNDLLVDEPAIDAERVVRETRFARLHVAPANLSLNNLDSRTAGEPDSQDYLADALDTARDRYDFIIIDCPPNLGTATRMALVAADGLIIPMEAQDYALSGSQHIIGFVNRIQKKANPRLTVIGFVINRFTASRSLEQKYNDLLRKQYPSLVFTTEFRNQVEYAQVATMQTPITHLLPHSPQAEAYRQFANEVIGRLIMVQSYDEIQNGNSRAAV